MANWASYWGQLLGRQVYRARKTRPPVDNFVQGVCPDPQESTVRSSVRTDPSRVCYEIRTTTKTQVILSIDYPGWDEDWDDVDR